jgi:hypothetical protein
VEERAVAHHLLLAGECHAALADQQVEVFDGLEVAIYQRLVDERPQILCGLQLGVMGWLQHEAGAVGHGEVLGSVPAGLGRCCWRRSTVDRRGIVDRLGLGSAFNN